MKSCNKLKSSGFSLIELSVVIVIIGILVIGITKGSRIINESKLKSARKLSISSPVNSIEGLTLWLDATNKDNIATGTIASNSYGNANNNDSVTNWKSQNSQSASQIIVSSGSDTSSPKYLTKGIGGLPTISFDGSDDYLDTLITPIPANAKELTYVVVWQADVVGGGIYRSIIDQDCNGSSGICVEKRAALLIMQDAQYGFIGETNDFYALPAPAKIPVITIMTYTNNTKYVRLAHNSLTFNYGGNSNGVNPSLTNAIFVVGANGRSPKGEFFTGYISEVIVFDRALRATEAKSISEYLSRKYSIKVN